MERALKKYFVIFALPTLIAFAISFLIPFFLGIYLSFTEFTTVTNSTWVGFENYKKAFVGNPDFLNALWFTLKFTVVSVISINLIAFRRRCSPLSTEDSSVKRQGSRCLPVSSHLR